jgi:RHS repeat-associated protein
MNRINGLWALGFLVAAVSLGGCGGCSSDGAHGDTNGSLDGGPDGSATTEPDANVDTDGGSIGNDGGSGSDATVGDADVDAGVDADTTVTTGYVYDQQERLIGVYDSFGNAVQEIVYIEGRPIALLRGGTAYAVQTDQLGAPRAVVAAGAVVVADAGAGDADVDAGDPDAAPPDAGSPFNGTVVWRWDPEPFGSTAPDEDPDGDNVKFVLNERFPGQRFDPVTGLFQNHHRNYAPEWGRYVEPDPIGLEGDPNIYAYVRGNPVSLIDPLGLMSPCEQFKRSGDHPRLERLCFDSRVTLRPGSKQYNDCEAYYPQRAAACKPPPPPPRGNACTNCGGGSMTQPDPDPPPPPAPPDCSKPINAVGRELYLKHCSG